MSLPWSPEAEGEISRIPFFVRARVRRKVEAEARQTGALQVTLEHLQACRQKFLRTMDAEVKGWQLETCLGLQDCPHRAVDPRDLVRDLEELLAGKNLREFLKSRIDGPLKMHHEFRVSLSACPNACSRPQIVDIGLIGSVNPILTQQPCSQCGQCAPACREGAIRLDDTGPHLDREICLQCGDCLKVCPSGTITAGTTGFQVLLGGKLGRHPQLGKKLPGIRPVREIIPLVESCLHHFMAHHREGQRFGDLLNRTGLPVS